MNLDLKNLEIERDPKDPSNIIAKFNNIELAKWKSNKEVSEKEIIMQGVKLGLLLYKMENSKLLENSKIYISSNSDFPYQIFFNNNKAFDSKNEYIDIFESNGKFIETFKLVDDEYTKEF